jgi:hypothetical protein
LISASWYQATYDPKRGGAQPPWQDWGAYSQFVAATVQSAQAQGIHVDYWEVENEPDTFYDTNVTMTPAHALQEFDVAQAAIRSVNPAAKIVGPSLAAFNDQPQLSTTIDLATFLDYVVAHHIRLDAVSWHEVGLRANVLNNPPDPESVVLDVARMRQMIAARPALGHPAIFINEYSSVATRLIPGWNVAWIASVERSGADGANRACWHADDVYGHFVAECSEGGLDGLFVPGSGLPQPPYWVHRAYADMGSGQRLATASSDGNLTSIGTRDDTSHTVRILVGRHQSCTPAVQNDCNQSPSATPAPADTTLRVTLPASWAATSAIVSVQQIPDVSGVLAGPIPVVTQTVAVGSAPVQVALPGFADGDAYSVTITVT